VKIAVLKESAPGERRVAVVPESVKRLIGRKLEVTVETGAGEGARASDEEYRTAGATVGPAAEIMAGADLIVKVQPPTVEEIGRLPEGSSLVSLLYALTPSGSKLAKAMAARKVTALSLDAIPRTTLAQMMDVLSSQATVSGYRAVILAAESLPKLFPMLMTAAGTIPPAKLLILGAGVAGLQAIATARRLGAVVEAFDVRKVAKEQVESLGARFIEVPTEEDAQTAGGYAKEVSEEYKQKQAVLLEQALGRCDACVTTALIPGRPAPTLITEKMVGAMRAGSVIVDLAAEQGGNCVLTKPGERIVTANGVTIVGDRNLPSQMATHASLMFSKNIEKLVAHLIPPKEGVMKLDTADEIVRGMLIARGGDIVQPQVAEAAARSAS
jgi:NAD(P) transhydrogenase subunit alpha